MKTPVQLISKKTATSFRRLFSKRSILLFALATGFVSNAIGQINNSEVFFL